MDWQQDQSLDWVKGWLIHKTQLFYSCTQFCVDPDDPFKITDETRSLGLVVCRGTAVVLICPSDSMEQIANPFIQPEAIWTAVAYTFINCLHQKENVKYLLSQRFIMRKRGPAQVQGLLEEEKREALGICGLVIKLLEIYSWFDYWLFFCLLPAWHFKFLCSG